MTKLGVTGNLFNFHDQVKSDMEKAKQNKATMQTEVYSLSGDLTAERAEEIIKEKIDEAKKASLVKPESYSNLISNRSYDTLLAESYGDSSYKDKTILIKKGLEYSLYEGRRELDEITAQKFTEGSGTANINFLDGASELSMDLNNKSKLDLENEFYYVNGILTELEGANSTRDKLSEIMDVNVETIYNPTEGAATDLLQAMSDVFDGGVIRDVYSKNIAELKKINSTDKLRAKIIERYDLEEYQDSEGKINDVDIKVALHFVDILKRGKHLKVIAHSHGTAVTANALVLTKKFLEDEIIFGSSAKEEAKVLLNRSDVILFGAAAKKSDFPTESNLVEIGNEDDPVANLTSNIEGAEKIYDLSGKKFKSELNKVNLKRLSSSLSNSDKIIDKSLDRNPKMKVLSKLSSLMPNKYISASVKVLSIGGALYNDSDLLSYSHSIDDNYLEQEKSQRLLKEFAHKSITEIQTEYNDRYDIENIFLELTKSKYSPRYE